MRRWIKFDWLRASFTCKISKEQKKQPLSNKISLKNCNVLGNPLKDKNKEKEKFGLIYHKADSLWQLISCWFKIWFWALSNEIYAFKVALLTGLLVWQLGSDSMKARLLAITMFAHAQTFDRRVIILALWICYLVLKWQNEEFSPHGSFGAHVTSKD